MKRIIAAFFHSMRGFGRAIHTEAAVREEVIALALGTVLALFLARSIGHYIVLVGVLLLLLAVEALNTAIEKLCDHVTPTQNEVIGYIKDLGSAAVFCLLVLSGLVWGSAFLQRIGLLSL